MKRLLAVTFAGASLLTASVWARGGPGAQGQGGRGFNLTRMQAELGLSDDQVAQIQKMKSDGRAQAIQQRANLSIAQGELQDLLRAPAVDEKAVGAKVKQVTDLQAAATQARVAQRLALRKVLTPDQLAKLDALPHGAGGGRHRGRRGQHEGDPDAQPGPAVQ